jgi:hypothetical protein
MKTLTLDLWLWLLVAAMLAATMCPPHILI